MAQYSNEIKIPKERVAILIGKKGETKKELENRTKTKMIIDSKEGDIFLSGNDALSLFDVVEVIKAIGRGFNPDIAFLILKQDYVFELINMNDFAKTKNDTIRLKGRVIGSEGKSRDTIEELTETNISVYGKTIGIIGLQENVASARRAIESLLSGSPHSNVFRFLEKNKRVMKSKEVFGKYIKK
jgi:ribosomal RNA assembly protein